MASSVLRVVLDTNVLLAGLVSHSSASQKIVDALTERKAIPLLSTPVLDEYRAVLLHSDILRRFAHLTPQRVAMALHKLRYVADEYRVIRTRFDFPRDPLDAKFIELAITGAATHILTLDPDLLELPQDRTQSGKRFRQRLPTLEIVRPANFLRHLVR